MLERPRKAGATKPIVFVVDDDAALRRALGRLLKAAGWEYETFSTAERFLDRQPAGRPSCLLLDIEMPGLSGLQLQKELAERGLDPAIVFLTGKGTVSKTVEAMKSGANDFLEKPVEADELLGALRSAIAADTRSRQARAKLVEVETRYETLTARERDVFALVVTGLLNKQVGGRLGTTEKTVKVHRGRVMRKMKAGSLTDLARMANRLASGGVIATMVD